MGRANLIWPLFILLIAGCKFTFSPYEVGPIKLHQNSTSLKKIQESESQFGTDFKVAFISDTHNYYEELDDLIGTINRRGPYSFVIVTGDITNQGLLEEYKKAKDYLDDLRFPYLVLAGNHDLLSNGERVFSNIFGETNFSFIFKDAEFIAFNNNNWESGGTVPNKIFVEAKLLASNSPHKILMAHVSPTDRDRFTTNEITSWRDLVTKYNVTYFIHGHNHNPGNSLFGTSTQITVGAPSKRVYLELLFSSGGVTHQQIHF